MKSINDAMIDAMTKGAGQILVKSDGSVTHIPQGDIYNFGVMKMLDGNSAAELNNDLPRTAAQRIEDYEREQEEAEQWRAIRDTLLSGKKWLSWA